MMKVSDEIVSFKFIVILRSIAVISPLIRFKNSQFKTDCLNPVKRV
jgi:hypothetical protein